MPRQKKDDQPPAADLLMAAEWLDYNEGGPDESGPCQRVAEWLRKEALRQQDEEIVRQLAKESGSTVARARQFWEKRKKKDEK